MGSVTVNAGPLQTAETMYLRVKRAIDLAVSSVALLMAAPVMLLVALIVRLALGSPVLFIQKRPGLNEKLFGCLKFRTLTDERDSAGKLLSDAARMTRLGLFLRRTSLDELPQLLNVLKGDLSLIGPRPLLTEYLPYYTVEERRRHSVRPGITGWAQIHGRNSLSFDARLAMDVWYVDNLSFALDLKILIQTAWIVLTQRGVSADTGVCGALHEIRASQPIAAHLVKTHDT